MEPSAMASRQAANNHKLNYYTSRVAKENDMMLGALFSRRSGFDFVQNCDLPPPLKVFTGVDKAVELSTNNNNNNNNRVYSMGREDDKNDCEFHHDQDGKLELFKALRLSQTRAREAERKAAGLAEEKQRISNAFMKDSLQLFAHRQWVRLLEIQVWVLKSQLPQQEMGYCCDKTEGFEGGNGDEISWSVALALCLGIASVGFAFGCKYFF